MECLEDFLQELKIECESPVIKESKKPVEKKEFKKKNQEKLKKKKGGYRPVLVDEQSLLNESIELESLMRLLRNKYSDRSLSDYDVVSLYLIGYLNQRYPNQFLENYNPISNDQQIESASYKDLIKFKNKNFETKLEKYKASTLFDIINKFNLHSVPHSARMALAKWYSNEYKLVLMFDSIPTPREVLVMQSEGKRCVSLISTGLHTLIMNERDALSFLLHDLVHAYKMFSNQILLQGQIGFSIAMVKLIQDEKANSLIEDLAKYDDKFLETFDYLISDMNSHTKHLFYYFKAILINGFKAKYNLNDEILNGESLQVFQETFDYFLDLFEMNDSEKTIARKMLMPVDNEDTTNNVKSSSKGFNVIDFTLLDRYFMELYFSCFNK